MTWLLTVGALGLFAAAVLIAEHYLFWHARAVFRRWPPAAYTLGLGTLFVCWFALAALWPDVGAMQHTAGCFGIAGFGGVADWAVWRWHPHQEALETQHEVSALKHTLEG